MRALDAKEVENIGFLTRYSIPYGLLEVTATGLRKGILDATEEYRDFLTKVKAHDYSMQSQGGDHKVVIPSIYISGDGSSVPTDATLYRPVTKKGDPRIWFSRLNHHVAPGDVIVSLWASDTIYLLNASQTDFSYVANNVAAFKALIRPLAGERESVFEELLGMLTTISSRGYIPVHKTGDTAVGHLLETELGIKANSRKIPDYKGVELKTTRAKNARTQTMFARVPDWSISSLKSSKEILESFGYMRGNDFKLYCTVTALDFNPQGLKFEVDDKAGLLHEVSNHPGVKNVATWRIKDLQDSLATKHADTFWIDAVSDRSNGQERIHFKAVRQTTKPIVDQLASMLASGAITMDHLIKRKGNAVSEKGPLFRISKRHFDTLFPNPIFHDLTK